MLEAILRRDTYRVGSRFGNVFLTNSWTLYVDFVEEPHDYAMSRLGIDPVSVVASGCLRRAFQSETEYIISWRSSIACDRGEVSEELVLALQRAIAQLLLPFDPSKIEGRRV